MRKVVALLLVCSLAEAAKVTGNEEEKYVETKRSLIDKISSTLAKEIYEKCKDKPYNVTQAPLKSLYFRCVKESANSTQYRSSNEFKQDVKQLKTNVGALSKSVVKQDKTIKPDAADKMEKLLTEKNLARIEVKMADKTMKRITAMKGIESEAAARAIIEVEINFCILVCINFG